MKLTTFEEFAKEEIEEVKWLVKPIIPATGIILVHGSTDAGKSALLFTLTDAVTSGKKFLNLESSAANVLYVNLDMPKSGLQERIRGAATPPSGFLIPYQQPFDVFAPGFKDSEVYCELQRLVGEHKIGLVIFDTLSDLVTGKMSDDEVALGVYKTLREWFPTTAVIISHHDRKMWRNQDGMGRPDDEDALGSQYWRSKAQSALHLYKVNDAVRELVHTKSHSGEKLPYPIKLTLEDSAMKVAVWDGKMKKEATSKLTEGIEKARQRYPNGQWEDLSEEGKVDAIGEAMQVNTRTVWRWKKTLVEGA